MAEVIDWPLCTLTPVEIALDHAWHSRDGGAGLNGVTQVVSPLSSLWEMSLSFSLFRATRIRSYRAIKMRLMGRTNHVRFPLFDPYRVRFGDAGWPEPPGIPFGDGSFFDDGTGFAGPDVSTTVSLAGSLGDDEVRFNVSSINDALSGGQFFSIDDFLYLVVGLGDKVGNNRTFRILPPLRADIAVGDIVKVGRPTLRCRLVDDRSGAVNMRLGKFGEPTMEFVEVLER